MRAVARATRATARENNPSSIVGVLFSKKKKKKKKEKADSPMSGKNEDYFFFFFFFFCFFHTIGLHCEQKKLIFENSRLKIALLRMRQ